MRGSLLSVNNSRTKERARNDGQILYQFCCLTAEKFATAIRNHWHVENKLHWRLDVVMNEDDCKIRRGNAAELFSGIRHIAINILTNDKVFKAGLRRKMRKAAMDRNYLASVLAGSGLS
ncbi:TPA: ISAs1 family transposase [Escherichia coli]